MSRYALQATNIHFSYRNHKVLHGATLDVREGEVVGLLGPNGTGKSTLLGVLAGDLEPSEGSVQLYGRPLASYDRSELARTRGVMPQSSEFPFSYTARDIVMMGRHPWKTSPADDRRIVEKAMKATDVAHLADRDVTQLSGGERARVTFARVLASQAQLIFLDEPTAALDIAHQERTMEICRCHARQGIGVLALMHDIQLAAAYCDRIALMSQGRVVAFGTPADVLTGDALTHVYGWPIDMRTLDSGELVVLPQRTYAVGSSHSENNSEEYELAPTPEPRRGSMAHEDNESSDPSSTKETS